ncbi:MAG TPA: hypothetical protein VFK02_13450, partial [Kofleriaceae bacterium]|nr:hypothetical protein [Kofleriaceae bacterium]
KRDPFNPTDIARYKAILRSNPHDAAALAKLLEMYRRYRTIDQLKDEYAKILDKSSDDVPALVVMGRLQHATGDDARALELFQRAVARKDDRMASGIGMRFVAMAKSHARMLREFCIEMRRRNLGSLLARIRA